MATETDGQAAKAQAEERARVTKIVEAIESWIVHIIRKEQCTDPLSAKMLNKSREKMVDMLVKDGREHGRDGL